MNNQQLQSLHPAGLSKPHRDVMSLKFPDCLGRKWSSKYYLAQMGPGLLKSQNPNDTALFEDMQYYGGGQNPNNDICNLTSDECGCHYYYSFKQCQRMSAEHHLLEKSSHKFVMSLHVHSFELIGEHIVDLDLEWHQSFTLNTLESACIHSETYIDRLKRTWEEWPTSYLLFWQKISRDCHVKEHLYATAHLYIYILLLHFKEHMLAQAYMKGAWPIEHPFNLHLRHLIPMRSSHS